MNSPIKKLVGQTAIYGLSSILGRFLNYLLVPLYVSDLVFRNPQDYGVVSELYAWVAFLMVFLTFGMETAYFKFLNDRSDKDHVFKNALLSVVSVNGGFLLLTLIFQGYIAKKLLFPENPEYIVLLAFIVVIDAISALPLAKLRAENQAKKFAFIQLTSIGVNIALNLFFLLILYDGENPEWAIRYILLSNLIASLVKSAFLYRDFLSMRWIWDTTLVRAMLRYSFPLAIAGFAFIVNETIDRILLKHLTYHSNLEELGQEAAKKLGEAQVGIYSASYKLAMLVTIFLQAYRYAAEPFFFAQAKDENRNKTYVKIMNYFVAALFICFLGVTLNIDIFKYFIPNQNYWAGLTVVPILLLANVFSGIYINQSIWYKLSGQTKFGAYIAGGGAILTIGINLLFIPYYGYVACAWATLIVYAAQMTVSYFLGQKHYPIPYNLRKFALYSLLAVGMFLLTQLIHLEFGWTQLLVHNGLIGFYILVVYTLERRVLTTT